MPWYNNVALHAICKCMQQKPCFIKQTKLKAVWTVFCRADKCPGELFAVHSSVNCSDCANFTYTRYKPTVGVAIFYILFKSPPTKSKKTNEKKNRLAFHFIIQNWVGCGNLVFQKELIYFDMLLYCTQQCYLTKITRICLNMAKK